MGLERWRKWYANGRSEASELRLERTSAPRTAAWARAGKWEKQISEAKNSAVGSEQESARLFWNGPDNKHFSLCGPCCVCVSYYSVLVAQSRLKRYYMNEQGCARLKMYLWTLELEFYVIFSYHEILLFFWPFPII